MTQNIDWINDIVEELVSRDYKLSETILKVKLLASRVKSDKLTSWVEDEIYGYKNKDVPNYRLLDVGIFGNLIQDRGFGNFFTRNEAPLPLEHLSDKIKEVIRQFHMRASISELEDMATSNEDFKSDIPYSIYPNISQGLSNNWKVDAAWQFIPKSKIQGIITKIKSVLIDFLMEISEEIGENENLNILKGKSKVDNIFDHTIGKISGETVNVTVGNENLQSVNVGEYSSSNVASGNNINQSISQDIKTEIKDFIEMLKEKMEDIPFAQEDKDDITFESNRVDVQLQRKKPKVGIIHNSLRVIESVLMGVAANAVTPTILDALAALLSKIG